MNKSKFLKKSLAMLLALMLVVAMIPLSASAATIDNLDLIYVDGNPVAFGDTVETKEDVVSVNLANLCSRAMSCGWTT